MGVIFDISSQISHISSEGLPCEQDYTFQWCISYFPWLYFSGGSSESCPTDVSIMLTTIPRPPPGNGLFLQGKARTDEPWDWNWHQRRQMVSLSLTAIPVSSFPPSLFSFLSLCSSPPLVFPSTFVPPSSCFPFSPRVLYRPWLMATDFLKWYSGLLWLLDPGGRRAGEAIEPLLSQCPQSFHPQRYPIRAMFSVSFCSGSQVQRQWIAFPIHLL